MQPSSEGFRPGSLQSSCRRWHPRGTMQRCGVSMSLTASARADVMQLSIYSELMSWKQARIGHIHVTFTLHAF